MVKKKRDYWNVLGKLSAFFAVLWFFGLMINVMLLFELAMGFILACSGLYGVLKRRMMEEALETEFERHVRTKRKEKMGEVIGEK